MHWLQSLNSNSCVLSPHVSWDTPNDTEQDTERDTKIQMDRNSRLAVYIVLGVALCAAAGVGIAALLGAFTKTVDLFGSLKIEGIEHNQR